MGLVFDDAFGANCFQFISVSFAHTAKVFAGQFEFWLPFFFGITLDSIKVGQYKNIYILFYWLPHQNIVFAGATFSIMDVSVMDIELLRAELESRGLDKEGTRAELQVILADAWDKEWEDMRTSPADLTLGDSDAHSGL